MKRLTLALLLTSALAGSCASNRLLGPCLSLAKAGLVGDPQQMTRIEKAMTDKEIADLLDANVRAKLPTAVAIARLHSRCSGWQPVLDDVGADELAGWEKAVKSVAEITAVHPVSPLAHGQSKPTLRSLRVAAAKMDCELLLVYLQSDSAVDNFTAAAILYWTGIGLWVAPGSRAEHRTAMQALLLDSRTGMILGTATGDSRLEKVYPAAFRKIQQEDLARRAPAEALPELQEHFGQLITRLTRKTACLPAGSRQVARANDVDGKGDNR